MKTSELKRLLSDYAELFDEKNNVIMGMYWTVWKLEQRLSIFGVIPAPVAKWIAEYTATPLEERKEEKKYRIKHNLSSTSNYLNFVCKDKTFIFSSKSLAEYYKNIFTEKEISEFPKEILGAIECGFLVKEEVE